MSFSRLRQYLCSSPVLVGLLSPAVLGLFWIGCAAEIQSAYLVAHYTVGMALSNATHVGIGRLFDRGHGVWFLPIATFLSVAYIGLSLGRLGLRWVCLVAALLLPFLIFGGGYAVVSFLFAPFILPPAVLGILDGEAWGEGRVAGVSIGTWLWLWGLVFLIEFRWQFQLSRVLGMLCLLIVVGSFANLLWGPTYFSTSFNLVTRETWTTTTWGALAYLTTTAGGVEVHFWALVGTLAFSLAVGGPSYFAMRDLLRPPNPPLKM